MGYYMGIDIGTYESKAMLIDEAGTRIAVASKAHEMESPKPGYAEHDAERDWWGDLCALSKELLRRARVNPADIRGVGCSAIGPCCLPVDERLRPLRKAILYGVDVRADAQIRRLNETLGEAAVLERYCNPITSQSIGPKILWIKENEPDVYGRAWKFLTASSYLVAKLTGRCVIDRYTAAYFTPMYDVRVNDWDYENLAPFCRPDQLAECLWADEIAGEITAEAAIETGLRPGTPVTVGTADAAADAVGVGVFDPGDMLLMFGSSVYIIHVVPELKADKRFWAGPYLFEGTYMVASGMSTTGALTRWFRDNLAPDYVRIQREGGEDAYQLLSRDAQAVPPGAEGLIALPYFSGERTPINDPAAKGMFFGLTTHHTRAHLYKACLEGVGYGIAQHFAGYGEMGMETKKVIAVGGGTKSAHWMQIVSDICGRELQVGGVYGAAFGDALLAALGAGAFASRADIIERIQIEGRIAPNLENTRRYAPGLSLYTELYDRNKDLMRRISDEL